MSQRIGYARVSTHEQDLNLQLDELKKNSCEVIYEEKVSSTSLARPELANCLKALREGDTLVVWRLDRLGRSLKDLVEIINDLEKRGVYFQSLTESIETSTAAGKLMFHVFSSLAEFERSLIRERTLAGLAAARARGRVGGRKPVLNDKQKREVRALLKDKEIPIASIMKRYKVSRATIYRASLEHTQGSLGDLNNE